MKTLKDFDLVFGQTFGSPAKDHTTYDRITGNIIYRTEDVTKNYIGIVKSPWLWDSFCFAADKLGGENVDPTEP